MSECIFRARLRTQPLIMFVRGRSAVWGLGPMGKRTATKHKAAD